MSTILVDSEKASIEDLLYDVAVFSYQQLVDSVHTIDIVIEAYHMDTSGWCTDRDEYFQIDVNSSDDIEEIIRTIIHEMVHVSQLVDKRLVLAKNLYLWEGEDHTQTLYNNQPWELEAYRLEEELYNIWSNRCS